MVLTGRPAAWTTPTADADTRRESAEIFMSGNSHRREASYRGPEKNTTTSGLRMAISSESSPFCALCNAATSAALQFFITEPFTFTLKTFRSEEHTSEL